MGNLRSAAWWQAAGTRALKTLAQSLAAFIVAGATGLSGVDWAVALDVAALAAVASLLTSLAGLPEVGE